MNGQSGATARAILAVTALGLALLVLALIGHVVLVVFGGVLLAILLSSCASFVSKMTGLNRSVSLGLVLLLVVAAFGGGGYALAPSVFEQARSFAAEIPAYAEQISRYLRRLPWGDALVSSLSISGDGSSGAIGSMISMSGMTLLSVLVDFGIILFAAIYLSIEPDLYVRGVTALLPLRHRARGREVLYEIGTTLFWWLIGRMVSMAVVGVLVGIGLWLLGVPLALGLGAWAAIVTFIPNVGPVLSTVLSAVVALQAGGEQLALYSIGLHLAVQIVESYFLTPLVQRRVIAMPPAMVLAAQAALAPLFGVTGVALATPILALGVVLTRQLYIGDYLGDEDAKHGIAAGEP